MANVGPLLFNPEAEKTVLGSVLIDPLALYEIKPLLNASDFARDDHAQIYDAMLALADAAKSVDVITLADELQRRNKLNTIGDGRGRGEAYLTGLINAVPTSTHAVHYARLVRDYALRRQLMSVAARIAKSANDDEAGVALNKALVWLGAINQQSQLRLQSSIDAVDEFLVHIQKWQEEQKEVWGLSTGIHDLDSLTGGLERGELVIIAGRPAMGKSALSLQIARHVAESGCGVAFFSLEMGLNQLMMRLVCSGARIDSMMVRRGKLTEQEKELLWQDMARIQVLPLWFCCRSGVTVQEVANETAKLQTTRDVSLVVFDYLQLARSEGESQNVRVSRISEALKHLAVSQNVCVLAVSQLSRAIEQRSEPTPRLSDLRDSGSLEQDGDKIIFLHQDEDNVVKVVLAKNRSGAAGMGLRNLIFLKEFAMFVDRARIT